MTGIALNTEYYIPYISDGQAGYLAAVWENCNIDIKRYESGLVHLTHESAMVHAYQLLSLNNVNIEYIESDNNLDCNEISIATKPPDYVSIIDEIIKDNSLLLKKVQLDIKYINCFIGQAMIKSGGKANPEIIRELLINKLSLNVE